MLKLQTILDLRDNINDQVRLLQTLCDDYLALVDDDLFTVDMTAEPRFTDEVWCGGFYLTFTTTHQLKQKYLVRFCDDFGLTLKSEEKTRNNEYIYLFKCKEENILDD